MMIDRLDGPSPTREVQLFVRKVSEVPWKPIGAKSYSRMGGRVGRRAVMGKAAARTYILREVSEWDDRVVAKGMEGKPTAWMEQDDLR